MRAKNCPNCKGKGKVLDFVSTVVKWKGRVMTNDELNVHKICSLCKGSGKVYQRPFRYPGYKMR